MADTDVKSVIHSLACQALDLGITDMAGEANGQLHNWLRGTPGYRDSIAFPLVMGVSMEMWHEQARREGYIDGYAKSVTEWHKKHDTPSNP